jgi:hypothetical protein
VPHRGCRQPAMRRAGLQRLCPGAAPLRMPHTVGLAALAQLLTTQLASGGAGAALTAQLAAVRRSSDEYALLVEALRDPFCRSGNAVSCGGRSGQRTVAAHRGDHRGIRPARPGPDDDCRLCLRLPFPEGLPQNRRTTPPAGRGRRAERDLRDLFRGRAATGPADLRPKAPLRGAGAAHARSGSQPFSLCSGSLMPITPYCW